MIDWDKTKLETDVTPETVRVRDRIYAICDKCGNGKYVVYRMYKRIGLQFYKCRLCSARESIVKAIANKPSSEVLSKASKKMWANNEYRTKVIRNIRKSMLSISGNISKKSKVTSKRLWQDQKYIESQRTAYYNTTEKRLKNLRDKMSREHIRQKLSDNMRKLWLDDEYRNRVTKSSTASYANMPRVSSIQKILYSMLDDLGIKYFREYDDHIDTECKIGPYIFDCMIPRDGRRALLIECNGDWIHSINKNAFRDNRKLSYINNNLSNRYEVKTIWEHEFKCPGKIINLLKYWLGITTSKIIDFNFDDVCVNKSHNIMECKTLLSKYHYLNNTGRNGITYAAYLGTELIAVCVFSPMIRQNILNNDSTRELSRLCIHPSYQKKNFASWFISRCIKLLPTKYKTIISYCDTSYNHDGAVYKACNFILDKIVRPDYWYVNQDGWVMHKKTLYNHAVKLHFTESEFSAKYGYVKVYGGRKLRFIFSRE